MLSPGSEELEAGSKPLLPSLTILSPWLITWSILRKSFPLKSINKGNWRNCKQIIIRSRSLCRYSFISTCFIKAFQYPLWTTENWEMEIFVPTFCSDPCWKIIWQTLLSFMLSYHDSYTAIPAQTNQKVYIRCRGKVTVQSTVFFRVFYKDINS